MRSAPLPPLLASAALLLVACGPASSARIAPAGEPAPTAVLDERPLQVLVVETPVTKDRPEMRDLKPHELEAILACAREANPRERIRGVHLYVDCEEACRLARVAFEPHATADRIRRFHTVSLCEETVEEENPSPRPAKVWLLIEPRSPLDTWLEICAPWRSFEGGLPPLDAENATLRADTGLGEETTLGIVDAVRALIPPGERIQSIEVDSERLRQMDEWQGRTRAPGVEVFDVWTTSGCSGHVFRVEHADGRWTAEPDGVWVA